MEPSDLLILLLRVLVGLIITWFLLPDDYQESIVRACEKRIESLEATISSRQRQQQPLKKPKNERRVSFGQLEIYEFPSVLGDNPCVKSGGAPVTLGWWPIRKSIVSVDDVMDDCRIRRRHRPKPLLPKEREQLLLSKGYNLSDIEAAASMAEQGRKTPQRWQQHRPGLSYPLRRRLRSIIARRGSVA